MSDAKRVVGICLATQLFIRQEKYLQDDFLDDFHVPFQEVDLLSANPQFNANHLEETRCHPVTLWTTKK